MAHRFAALLSIIFVFAGCATTDLSSKPDHTVDHVGDAMDVEKRRTIVRLKAGSDCPGRKLDETNGVLCLIEYPEGWQPFVHNGILYYKIKLAGI